MKTSTSKYKVGDKVYMRPGFSSDQKHHNYIGHGYIKDSKKKLTIKSIELDTNDHFGGQWLYFFEEIMDGVAEKALIDISEERNKKLTRLGL
jgi:hypothetical protein